MKVSLCFMVIKKYTLFVRCHTDRVVKTATRRTPQRREHDKLSVAGNASGEPGVEPNGAAGSGASLPVPDKGRLRISSILDVSLSIAILVELVVAVGKPTHQRDYDIAGIFGGGFSRYEKDRHLRLFQFVRYSHARR